MRRSGSVAVVTAMIVASAIAAEAQFIATPSAVTVYPGQTSVVIALDLTFPWCEGGSYTLSFAGIPAGASTVPATVGYTVTPACTGQTSFQFATSTSTVPGTYAVVITDPEEIGAKPSAGSVIVSLTVLNPGFNAVINPNPVTLTIGGGPATVSVTTATDPGFAEPGIVYSFAGLPSFIRTGDPQTSSSPAYPPVQFQFSLIDGAVVGTYPGILEARNVSGDLLDSFPVSVIINPALAPTVNAVIPDTIQRGSSNVSFVVNGTNFVDGAEVQVSGVGVNWDQVEFVSPNQLRFVGSATLTAPLGLRMVTIRNPDGQLSNPGTLTVVPAAPPTVSAVIPDTLQRGSSNVPFVVNGTGFVDGAEVLVSGAGVSWDQVEFVSPNQLRFAGSATLTAPLGPRTVTIRNPDGQVSNPGTLTVVPAPAPVIASLVPTSITRGEGERQFTIQGSGFQPGATPAVSGGGVHLDDVQLVSPNQMIFVAAAEADAPLGARMVTVTNPDGQRSNPVTLTVHPRPPVITGITPPSLAAGQLSVVLTVTGDHFQPGATAVSLSPSVAVEETVVLSPTVARATVTVRAESPPGPVAIEMRNPDGGVSMPPGTVLVYPTSALGAPLGVTVAAIVFPRPGTLIGPDEELYPRALLSTTGTGTIVASWRLDGVPFDIVTTTTSGGAPAEVTAQMPIPASFVGDHLLELSIENPASTIVASMTVTRTERRESSLRLYGPEDGAVVGRRPVTFHWSLVPGAEYYEVEIERDPPLLPVVIRAANARWRPTASERELIGPGLHRWRVWPVFPGEVHGTPTSTRRIALLPDTVHLVVQPPDREPETGRTRVRWSGGSPGLLYRVDVLAQTTDEIRFSALSAVQEYVIPEAAPEGIEGRRVRVTALGPGGEVYGSATTPVLEVWSEGVVGTVSFADAGEDPRIDQISPADGAEVTTSQPTVAARWIGDVNPAQIMLMVDTVDVTPVCARRPTSVRYDSLVPLDSGVHTVRLSLGDQATTWSFTVVLPTPPAGEVREGDATPPVVNEEEDNVVAGSETPFEWVVGTQATVVAADEDVDTQSDAVFLQLSGQADVESGAFSLKGAGGLSVRHDFEEPTGTNQQSRDWLLLGGVESASGSYRGDVSVGYATPRFASGAQLVTTGLARGGVEVGFGLPVLDASVYRSFTTAPAGVAAGTVGPEQEILAWSVGAPERFERFDLRIIGMKVEDEPGFNSAGGEGTIYGLFGQIVITPGLTVVFEGARGDFTPGPTSVEDEKSGNAFRIGLTGVRGTFSYTLNLRSVDADFVNPANRGFTIGGVPDRQGGDLQLMKSFGRTSLSGSVRYLEAGNSSGAVSPSTSETNAMVQLSSMLSDVVTLQVGANLSDISGDGDPETLLPPTDLRMEGLNATVSERVGKFSLSQSLFRQEMNNDVLPDSDQTTSTANFSASGVITDSFMLFGLLSGTRVAGSEAVGTTETKLVSVQPTWTARSVGISVQPRASYSRTENDSLSLDTRSEQYQLLVSWTPSSLNQHLSLQASGDWNRSRSRGLPDAGFTQRLALTVNFTWGAGSAARGLPPSDPVFGPSPHAGPSGYPIAMATGLPGDVPWIGRR